MKVGVSVLGSGSSGNALLIRRGDSGILIDIGFSCKEMVRRLSLIDFKPENLKALFLTHEDGDHTKGLRVFCKKFNITPWITSTTMNELKNRGTFKDEVFNFFPIQAGNDYDIEEFTVHPFKVQHDGVDPVGFTVLVDGFKIGVVTDIGVINSLAVTHLQNCDVIVLESNHDIKMVRDSDRKLELKRRILGRNGHLNNEDAMSALDKILALKTKCVIFYHLSRDCNKEEIVDALAVAKLASLKRDDVDYVIARQDEPSETIWL